MESMPNRSILAAFYSNTAVMFLVGSSVPLPKHSMILNEKLSYMKYNFTLPEWMVSSPVSVYRAWTLAASAEYLKSSTAAIVLASEVKTEPNLDRRSI